MHRAAEAAGSRWCIYIYIYIQAVQSATGRDLNKKAAAALFTTKNDIYYISKTINSSSSNNNKSLARFAAARRVTISVTRMIDEMAKIHGSWLLFFLYIFLENIVRLSYNIPFSYANKKNTPFEFLRSRKKIDNINKVVKSWPIYGADFLVELCVSRKICFTRCKENRGMVRQKGEFEEKGYMGFLYVTYSRDSKYLLGDWRQHNFEYRKLIGHAMNWCLEKFKIFCKKLLLIKKLI